MSPVLTVDSAFGTSQTDVTPFIGRQTYKVGDAVTVSVKNPSFKQTRLLGGPFKIDLPKVWTCTGYSGTGDVPKSGAATSVSFSITQDSSITWNWASENQWAAQATSIVTFIAILVVAILGYYWLKRPFIVAVFGGSLGGLLHEIVQSGGKYVLPNIDESGNFVLGGLVGIVTGGVAGLLLYQGLLGTNTSVPLNALLAVGSLLAGLAVKGLADAPNPKKT